MTGIYSKESDSKNENKITGWGSAEIHQLNQELHHETAELKHKNKELEIQLRQQSDKIKDQDRIIGYLHKKSNGKSPEARQSRPQMQVRAP